MFKPSIPQTRSLDKQWQALFGDFVDRFALYLSRPQRHHFRHLILTMILWVGTHTINQLTEVQRYLWQRDQSNVNRFINRAPWKPAWLRRTRWQWVLEHLSAVLPAPYRDTTSAVVTGYLVIDDTVVRKTGQKMAGLGWHYSHADQQQVWGHAFVTALYVIAGYAYPVGVLLYQSQQACSQSGSKFRSKLELAAQLIAEFTPVPGTRTVVLFDSWYASSTLIQVALDRRFEVVCAVKSNRVLRKCAHAPYAQGISLDELATRTGMPVHLVTVNHRAYRVRQVDGYLKGNLRARIVISAAPSHKTRFYAHFQPEQEAVSPLDAQELLHHYSHRWPVETFHRNAKQLLGFDDYRLRSISGVERYLELVLIAYTLAETQRGLLASQDTDQPPPSLGDVCRQSQHHAQLLFVSWLYAQFERGMTVETVCHRLTG